MDFKLGVALIQRNKEIIYKETVFSACFLVFGEVWHFRYFAFSLNEKTLLKGLETIENLYKKMHKTAHFQILTKKYFKKWKVGKLKTRKPWQSWKSRISNIKNLGLKSSGKKFWDFRGFRYFWVFDLALVVGGEWMTMNEWRLVTIFSFAAVVDNLIDHPVLLKKANKLFLPYIILHNRDKANWNK